MLRTRDYWVAAMCSGHNRSCAVAPEDPARPRLPACKHEKREQVRDIEEAVDDAGCSLRTQAAVSPPCTTSTTTGCVPALAARASCGRNYRSITDRLLINYCSSWRTGDGVQSYFIVNTRSKRTHCAPQSAGDRVC